MPASALRTEPQAKEGGPKAVAVAEKVRASMVIDGAVRIPGWVVDLASFRRWAYSDEFPERGRFSYLGGELWADLTMEQLYTHNQVKGEFAIVLGALVKATQSGRFFHDRTFLSNPDADLSTEPDGLFASYDTMRAGRVRPVEGAEEGYVELEGTPDMVLEVVSPSSVQKDTVRLRELYWRAGGPEYWLVDARRRSPRFDLLRHGAKRYVATRRQAGWLPSAVFGRSFRLTQQADPLGQPLYTLSVQP
jgi:Uma2 family endonuclease